MAMQRDRKSHGLTALRVVGALLPPEFLQTVARLEAKRQNGTDYGLSKSLVLKDEIARYWRIANDLYAAYAERRKRRDLDPKKVGIEEWLAPLLKDVLGYADLTSASPLVIGERRFPITHRALDTTVPAVLTVRDVDLDRADPRFGDEGRRRAAHGLMQELLNADDSCLWGLISNGVTLRLLRDNPSLTRPAYIEADLERIFEEQLYSDFAALWLALHASRLRPVDGNTSACILEAWRLQAHDTGERALEHLRDGVTVALRALGNGFLQHPENERLRAAFADGSFSTDAYFQQLLRLVYRLLFLFAADERNLLHLPDTTDQQRQLYRDGYGLSRLRERALRRRHYDRYTDLWQSLRILFVALAEGAPALGLPALGGLFTTDQCAELDSACISNEALLEAIRALAYFRNGPTLTRVNYRDMGTEELGSVYESLLELQPYLDVNASPWAFGFVGQDNDENAKGSARKLTGSYYTPAVLVNELVSSTLEPIIVKSVEAKPEDPRSALLDLKIVDPACGSGHFLLAAARRIAAEIARIEAQSDTPDEAARQHALREVVQHCIYGVDRNPLAVELCRTALWIEALEPGKPLTFLDQHVQCGDSLIGIIDPVTMADGIPDDAYKPLTGDDAKVCRNLKQRNQQSGRTVQGSLFDQESFKSAAETTAHVDAMPEETLEEINAKRDAWQSVHHAANRRREELRANLFVAAFFALKTQLTADSVPVTEDLNRIDGAMALRDGMELFVSNLAERHRFFHWYVAFPEIMQRGGFDVILGNPPWERVKLQEQEFFAHRSPAIAKAPNKAAREKMIKALGKPSASDAEKAMRGVFEDAKHAAEGTSQFLRSSGRFSLTGTGDINTYAVFAETFLNLTSAHGRAGVIVPTGIATEDTNKRFFSSIVSHNRLSSLFSFYEVRQMFRDTDSRQPFCLLTLKGAIGGDSTSAKFCFGLTNVGDLRLQERVFTLSQADLDLLSPNTGTAPIFRSTNDAELTKAIYKRIAVLINENRAKGGNPWGVKFSTMFHMSNDSSLFRTFVQLESDGARREGERWIDNADNTWVPFYEAKMMYQFDHRYGSFSRLSSRTNVELPRPELHQYRDPSYEPRPWYWVSEKAVQLNLHDWKRGWLIVFRDITNAASERTGIFSVIPAVGVANNAPLLMTNEATRSPILATCLLGNLNSMVFDYCARQKVSGLHLNFHFLKQLPVLPPLLFTESDFSYILPRIAELSATSWNVKVFLDDIWQEASPSLRALLEQQWKENRLAAGGQADEMPPWYAPSEGGFPYSPFKWDEERRARLRAELDAYYARLYGLTRDELRYVLDPTEACGVDYPSQTFRVLKENEIKKFSEYRTARLVLHAWDTHERDVIGSTEVLSPTA